MLTRIDQVPLMACVLSKDLQVVDHTIALTDAIGELVKRWQTLSDISPDLAAKVNSLCASEGASQSMPITGQCTATTAKKMIALKWSFYFASDQDQLHWLVIESVQDHTHSTIQLVESNAAFLGELLEHVADPIFVKDENHRWIYGNSAFWSLLGDKEFYLGKNDKNIFPEDEVAVFWEMDERVIQQGVVTENEETISSPNGETIIARTKKAPLVLPDGSPGLVAVIRDISAFRRAEVDAEHYRLEAVHKSNFLANMSHELRTPMNGVLGMTDILSMSNLPGDAQDKIAIIKESGETLLSLLDNVLDLSKIEAGKVAIELIDTDIVSVLTSVASLFDIQADEKGLWLNRDFDIDILPVRIMTDPTRVRQVLTNLLSNAIKFTRDGGVTLSVSQNLVDDERVETRIGVSDTGVGLDDSKHEHIFEAFVQADQSTTRQYGGTGLGLSISKQLVELMDGQIGVTSEPGNGATFWFTLVSDKAGSEHTAGAERASSSRR